MKNLYKMLFLLAKWWEIRTCFFRPNDERKRTPSYHYCCHQTKSVTSSLLKPSFPNFQPKSSPQFLCPRLVALWSFIKLIACQHKQTSTLFPHSLPSSSFVIFYILPTNFKPFIPLKNMPTSSHHHKPLLTSAIRLTLLPKLAQNMMLMHFSYHVSHILVQTLTLPLCYYSLFTSPTGKIQPDIHHCLFTDHLLHQVMSVWTF